MKSILEAKIKNDPQFAKLFAEEKAVLEATEMICEWMENKKISRAELARRLNTTRANVTQRLNGKNASLRSLAAMAYALGGELHFKISEIQVACDNKEINFQGGKFIQPSRWGKTKFMDTNIENAKEVEGLAI